MSPGSFSIVMPTYQRRDVVCDAVRAVARLEYSGAFELIVVVDGSTDGTAEALRAIELPVPFRVIEQANAGAAAARNRGASGASGDIVLFLDDDMICEPDLLTQHALCYPEGADAVIGDFVLDEHSLPGFLSDAIARWSRSFRDACVERGEVGACDLFSGQFSIKRDVFVSLGGFDETLTRGDIFAGEDTDMGVRLLRAHKLVHNPKALTRQRYVVTPRELMKRATKMARGGAEFLNRYPELAGDYFAEQTTSRPVNQLLYRPLGRLPGVPRLLAASLAQAGELIMRTRWRHSLLFGRLFHSGWSVAFWSALERAAGPSFRRSVTVLCYHAIADHSDDPFLAPYSVPPATFRRQIDWLARHGYHFLSPQDFADFLDGVSIPPPKSVLLTFDDCYRDLAEAVRNELAPRGIPALAFHVADIPSNSNEWDQPRGAPRKDLLTALELDELRADGLEVGSHSLTHRALPSLSQPEQAREVGESIEALERAGLPRPRFFAYPYGAHDHASRRAASRAGFVAAFGINRASADRFCDRFDIPRVSIMANDLGLRLRLKTSMPNLYAWLADLRSRLA